IEVRDLIDPPQLVGGLLRGDLRLLGSGLLGEVGRAGLAELALLVPAHLGADPVTAARALVELRPDLVDRLLEGGVPGLTAQAVLHVLAGLAGGPEGAAAEQAAQALGDLGSHAELGCVPGRAVAVATLVAMELELIAGVAAVVGVVACEGSRAHGWPV